MPIRLIDKGTPLPALSPQGGERMAAGRERGSCLQDQNLSIDRIGVEGFLFRVVILDDEFLPLRRDPIRDGEFSVRGSIPLRAGNACLPGAPIRPGAFPKYSSLPPHNP